MSTSTTGVEYEYDEWWVWAQVSQLSSMSMVNDEYERGSGGSVWIDQTRPVPAFIHRWIVADDLPHDHHNRQGVDNDVIRMKILVIQIELSFWPEDIILNEMDSVCCNGLENNNNKVLVLRLTAQKAPVIP